eukprot:11963545-Prorocentrum_lima.AAC.1
MAWHGSPCREPRSQGDAVASMCYARAPEAPGTLAGGGRPVALRADEGGAPPATGVASVLMP